METRTINLKILMTAMILIACCALLPTTVYAHCDTMNGPVILEAKTALEKGDVTPLLKWIKRENEAELKAAFRKAIAVRVKGPEAKDLADRYFLETLVRLHRAGEGEPYSGIKDEPVEPIVTMADEAITNGSAGEMIKKISGHMAEAIREKLIKVLDAKKNKDQSVEAGRAYVEAYVTYMHYVEDIHATIMSAGSHDHTGIPKGTVDAAAKRPEHKE